MRLLIQALLAYARLGRASLRLEAVDTGALVAEVLSAVGTDLVARVEVGELPVVNADRAQLGQVFQNLLANALKFVDHDSPAVSVKAERDGTAWRFDVADNGIGIDPRYAERIFEVFERLHSRDHFEGTGIGLSICERVVERHGGRIWAEAGAEVGTVFSFTIPDHEVS